MIRRKAADCIIGNHYWKVFTAPISVRATFWFPKSLRLQYIFLCAMYWEILFSYSYAPPEDLQKYTLYTQKKGLKRRIRIKEKNENRMNTNDKSPWSLIKSKANILQNQFGSVFTIEPGIKIYRNSTIDQKHQKKLSILQLRLSERKSWNSVVAGKAIGLNEISPRLSNDIANHVASPLASLFN